MSRRVAVGTALAGGVSLAFLGTQRDETSAQVPANLPRVAVRSFGARGDGRTDDTRAFQRAHDSLRGGGVIVVEPGTYRLNRIDIRHRFIQIELAPEAVLRKIGPAGPSLRGMFTVADLLDANFVLRGGRIDLNGEGPMGIGQPGRIPNLYAALMVPTVNALAGPANAAVFGLRSSRITVSNVTIENSGESGLLFRNCGDTLVENSRFRNLANYGVEWSLVDPAHDQGRGSVPDRARNRVHGCAFQDIDDYGLGSGNGIGVGGGGANDEWVNDYSVTDCTFLRCQRDFHLEFTPGSGVDGLELIRLRSTDARQGSIGLIGVRNCVIRVCVLTNPGYAPSSALGPHWPSIYGVTASSDFRSLLLDRVQVVDSRDSKVNIGDDGEIAAGARRFRSAMANFTAADVGTFIGIRGANPQGVCYVGRIAEVISASEADLDLPAARSVRRAEFAYGGACREGLRLYHGTSAALENCRIEAGTHSRLPGEPPSAAIRIENVRSPVTIAGSTVIAPRTRGTAPVGVDVVRGSLSGPRNTPPGLQVSGFQRNLLERG